MMTHCTIDMMSHNRTGTVKIGSYILAINGDNLAGRTITQVEEMLENCGNSVTLKIKKNIKQTSKIVNWCDSSNSMLL